MPRPPPQPGQGKKPLSLRCAQCKLQQRTAEFIPPPLDADPARITHRQDSTVQYHGISCVCGHWTTGGYLPGHR